MTVRSAATTLHHMAYRGEPSRRMMNSDTDSHIWNNIEGPNHNRYVTTSEDRCSEEPSNLSVS